jgi:hypothetical protein
MDSGRPRPWDLRNPNPGDKARYSEHADAHRSARKPGIGPHASKRVQPTPSTARASVSNATHPAPIRLKSAPISPSPSDHGTMSIRSARASYVGSSHWKAVLDSITELRKHLPQEEDAINLTPDLGSSPISFPKPQILYNGTVHETPVSIIKSIPPRSVVDRLISRYFNMLDIAPASWLNFGLSLWE